ncbi:MAG: hypothetical protein PHY77_03710 [Desulfotomaculaceae bacterium]|nr:hypothetical protein [Desulfotomaculaceae bacterium]
MDNKTDAKAEAMTGSHMTDMCPMDPRALFDAIATHGRNKAALYNVLAQCAPAPCLQRMIAQMATEGANQSAALNAIAAAYGIGAAMPIMPADRRP